MAENNSDILRNIKVSGFKSIDKMDLTLKPLNIIVGQNGAGKSNLIGVFDLLYNIGEQTLQKYISMNGGANRFLRFGAKNTNHIELKLDFLFNTYECYLLYS